MSESETLLSLAIELARRAGALQRERYETPLEIGTKSAPVDLVTEVDKACEALIVAALATQRPHDAILAEEGGGRDREGATWRWVIDPLDGTTNYAHGYPRFCVSIGIEREGERALGVVYDPLMDELYHAVRGAGAFRNGKAIRVSPEPELGRSLLATGFAYDRRESEVDNLDHFGAFLKRARALRRDGSAALDLCYVASGRLEGYWELKLQRWDIAAGALLVDEAGGRFSDFTGSGPASSGRQVVASNGRIHDAMLALLRGAACALLLLAATAQAQDATPLVGPTGSAATSLESYLEQPGRLLVERRHALPAIALEGETRLVLEAIIAYEPAREQERVLGVRARLRGAGGVRTIHLDLHEVEDLARTLAALPGVVDVERAQQATVEIRYTTRDGLGIAATTGAAPSRRLLRVAGSPPVELALSDAALEELRTQLDACRRYLFEK